MIGSVLRVRYEITGALADGPIFTTYSARDRTLGRDVCVRILKPPFSHETSFIELLRNSARRTVLLQHPNIESLYDVEEHEGNVFIVSELTRGPSLSDRIRKLAPFSVPVSVGMVISILTAVDALQKAGVVHGDLNPGNIAVMGDGQARLQLAGMWEAYRGSNTAGSMVLPSMAPYLAPEVSSGGNPSASSDLYAIGVLLYELLSGRQPFYGETDLATAMRHRTEATPSVRQINPSVPEALDEIVRIAMEKDPEQRYSTAAEMLTDLRLVQDALRFGKALGKSVRVAGKAQKPVSDPRPVTPRMSAVRTDAEAEALPRKARKERDVPIWMLVVITALGATLLSLVGVWVLFNMKSPKLVQVPKLTGLSVQEAVEVLEDNKLRLKVNQKINNEKVPAGQIVETLPEEGQKVREGGQVLVNVSNGSKYVSMPDVRNMTLDKARSVLSGLDLDVEVPVQNIRSSSVPVGSIARQTPPPRQKIARFDRVRLYVSTGSSGDSSGGPSANVIYQYTVKVDMSEIDEPVMVRIDILDPESPEGRTIYNSQHSGGEVFEVETQSSAPKVQFKIFYDDEEMLTIDEQAEGARRG